MADSGLKYLNTDVYKKKWDTLGWREEDSRHALFPLAIGPLCRHLVKVKQLEYLLALSCKRRHFRLWQNQL
jgi:hypothetical protein